MVGVTLAGILLIPAHQQGTQMPGVVMWQEADPLKDIASLRYDKRAIGASTPLPLPQNPHQPTPQELKAMQDFVVCDNFVGNARASLQYLQQQPEIDPARAALIGHSERNTIVGQVAAAVRGLAHPPAPLVLISAPGRLIDVVLREQIAYQLQQQPTITAAFVLGKYDEIISSLKQTGKPSNAAFSDLNANSQVPPQFTQNLMALF